MALAELLSIVALNLAIESALIRAMSAFVGLPYASKKGWYIFTLQSNMFSDFCDKSFQKSSVDSVPSSILIL